MRNAGLILVCRDVFTIYNRRCAETERCQSDPAPAALKPISSRYAAPPLPAAVAVSPLTVMVVTPAPPSAKVKIRSALADCAAKRNMARTSSGHVKCTPKSRGHEKTRTGKNDEFEA